MYLTDYSVIETPVKKLYDSVLQLSGPHKRRSKQDKVHPQNWFDANT